MADLIDRTALGIGEANREVFENPAYADGWNSAIKIIKAASTVDAVPVVQCKDCKHRTVAGRAPFMVFVCRNNKGLSDGIKGNDFCSYGERREENGGTTSD